jgi:hypothetical protein
MQMETARVPDALAQVHVSCAERKSQTTACDRQGRHIGGQDLSCVVRALRHVTAGNDSDSIKVVVLDQEHQLHITNRQTLESIALRATGGDMHFQINLTDTVRNPSCAACAWLEIRPCPVPHSSMCITKMTVRLPSISGESTLYDGAYPSTWVVGTTIQSALPATMPPDIPLLASARHLRTCRAARTPRGTRSTTALPALRRPRRRSHHRSATNVLRPFRRS